MDLLLSSCIYIFSFSQEEYIRVFPKGKGIALFANVKKNSLRDAMLCEKGQKKAKHRI